MAGNMTQYLLRSIFLTTVAVMLCGCCTDCKFPLDNSNNPNDIRIYPADDYNELFTRYGGGWTGGNGGFSLKLSDGRVMWLFWETFLDTVYSDRTRPADAKMIDNSIVIQDWNNLTTLYGGTEESPTAYLTPPDSGLKYFPLGAIETADEIQIICAAIDIKYTYWYVFNGEKNIDVVSLSKEDFAVTNITRKISGTSILYGAGILKDGDHIYIYGTHFGDLSFARTGSGGLMNQWEYKTGIGWTTDSEQAFIYSSGIVFPWFMNVLKRNGNYYTIAHSNGDYDRLLLIETTSPTNEWTIVKMLFGSSIVWSDIILDPVIHKDLSTPDQLLISFNIRNEDAMYNDADSYTIYFVRIENIW